MLLQDFKLRQEKQKRTWFLCLKEDVSKAKVRADLANCLAERLQQANQRQAFEALKTMALSGR